MLEEKTFKDHCGVCGVWGHPEASRLVYLGLHALQHRGQESAGIVTSDGQIMRSHVGMGLVVDVFKRKVLDMLPGNSAVGHVRYSTAGDSALRNAQPIMVTTSLGKLALAHNGNLTNAQELRKGLEKMGSIFQTTSDSEVILHLIARSRTRNLEEAVAGALRRVKGAYSLLLLAKHDLIAIRDPWGVRPLSIGKVGRTYVIASETCVFDLLGARFLRNVEPGEMVRVGKKGLKISRLFPVKNKHALCIFEFIYFSRPDSYVFGPSVYSIRRELGRQLAREAPVEADMVIPVPDSASVAAVGYAEEARIPYEMGFIRSHYVGRTFIEPKQSIRDFGAKLKYNAVREAVAGKRVVLVDDSIVRGTTSRKLVRMLKRAGVKEIHMRISSPPIINPCLYGIDTPTKAELIAATHSVEEITKYLEVDSLRYLSLEGMIAATGMERNEFCNACFTGKYPI